jgi:putative tryptophan/tyrosine transport system substrate-binding protein
LKRRSFIAGLGAAIASPRLVRAQKPSPRKWRIGVLLAERGQNAIRLGLRDLGYIEGENLLIELRSSHSGVDFVAPAAELVATRPDVLVTAGTQAALALKQATSDIPIVMASSDPVATGLIASLAHPGGNVTGFSLFSPEVSGKRVELLRDAAGIISTLAILWNPSDPPAAISLKETERAVEAAALKSTAIAVQSLDDFAPAFASLERLRAGGLVILPAPLMDLNAARIADFAASAKLPSIYPDPSYPRAGGLMSYGPDFFGLIRDEAVYVDKIIKGAKPADLPVAQPTKFNLVINLKAAKQLGVNIPPTMLARADEVIE